MKRYGIVFLFISHPVTDPVSSSWTPGLSSVLATSSQQGDAQERLRLHLHRDRRPLPPGAFPVLQHLAVQRHAAILLGALVLL